MDVAPIIFLDFDGVIRLGDGSGPKSFRFVPEKIGYVRDLVERVDARVVVTSTWRELFRLDRIVDEMDEILTPDQFHDSWMTPLLRVQSRTDERNIPRGAEIMTWLHSHPEVTAFVIFDDLPESHFTLYQDR